MAEISIIEYTPGSVIGDGPPSSVTIRIGSRVVKWPSYTTPSVIPGKKDGELEVQDLGFLVPFPTGDPLYVGEAFPCWTPYVYYDGLPFSPGIQIQYPIGPIADIGSPRGQVLHSGYSGMPGEIAMIGGDLCFCRNGATSFPGGFPGTLPGPMDWVSFDYVNWGPWVPA